MPTHHMHLNAGPFKKTKSGIKKMECRMWDAKRRAILPGDTLVFTHRDDPTQTLSARVTSLHIHPTFADLFTTLPPTLTGITDFHKTLCKMEEYYPLSLQHQNNVVGICFSLLEEQ